MKFLYTDLSAVARKLVVTLSCSMEYIITASCRKGFRDECPSDESDDPIISSDDKADCEIASNGNDGRNTFIIKRRRWHEAI